LIVRSGAPEGVLAPDAILPLRSFRAGPDECFVRRADTLFELADALLSTGPVTSLPHLSLETVHGRGWGSLYDPLAAGRLEAEAAHVAWSPLGEALRWLAAGLESPAAA
jgi:hypothetical protein